MDLSSDASLDSSSVFSYASSEYDPVNSPALQSFSSNYFTDPDDLADFDLGDLDSVGNSPSPSDDFDYDPAPADYVSPPPLDWCPLELEILLDPGFNLDLPWFLQILEDSQ